MRVLKKITCGAAGCLLLLGAGAAAAQEQEPEQPVPQESRRPFRMGMEIFTASIDSQAAGEEGTGERMWGLQFRGEATKFHVLAVSIDLGMLGMKDRRPFSQNTTGGMRSSGNTVMGGIGTLAVGVRTPSLALGGKDGPVALAAAINAGHTLISATRSISQCLDCHGETVHIRGGNFLEPGVQIFGRRRGLSVRYRVYEERSELQNALVIGLFGPR